MKNLFYKLWPLLTIIAIFIGLSNLNDSKTIVENIGGLITKISDKPLKCGPNCVYPIEVRVEGEILKRNLSLECLSDLEVGQIAPLKKFTKIESWIWQEVPDTTIFYKLNL